MASKVVTGAPEALAGVAEPLPEPEVFLGLGPHMGNAPAIAEHLDWRRDPLDLDIARPLRQRPQHGRRTGEGFLRSLPVNGPRLFLGFFHRGSIAHLTLTAVYRCVKSWERPL